MSETYRPTESPATSMSPEEQQALFEQHRQSTLNVMDGHLTRQAIEADIKQDAAILTHLSTL